MKKVLVVDDEPVILEAIISSLRKTGSYDVDGTCDPQKAYQLAERRDYDLLICDFSMPTLNGDTLFLYLGIDPEDPMGRRKQPELLMISGSLSQEELESRMKFVGGKAFLTKPFDLNELLKKVRDILGE